MPGCGNLDRDLAQNGKRNRTHAPVGPGLQRRTGLARIFVGNGNAPIALRDARDLAVVADDLRADLTHEGFADRIHATDGLEQGGLVFVGPA